MEARSGEAGRWEGLRSSLTDYRAPPLRASRALRTTLRTAHMIAFSAYYGGHVFSVAPERLLPALVAVIATGGTFMSFEIWRAPVWLVQIRGLACYAKLSLLLSVAAYWEYRIAILTLVVVIATLISHAPGHIRYYSLLHLRVVNTDSKG
jgi:hypothetical protein